MENDELVKIKYYDYINKKVVELEVSSEVAKYIKKSERTSRKKQAIYNKYNIPLEVAMKDVNNIDKFTDNSQFKEIDNKIMLEQFINNNPELLKNYFKDYDETKKQEILENLLYDTDDETITRLKELILGSD